MRELDRLISAIQAHQRRSGESLQSIAIRAGVPQRSLSGITQGHNPSLDRAAEICKALGLEFYMGPPRRTPTPDAENTLAIPLSEIERAMRDLVRLTVNAGGDPIPKDVWPSLAVRPGETEPWTEYDLVPPIDRPVEVAELAAAAGGGAGTLGEEATSPVWFRLGWLKQRGFDPSECVVIRVLGESMAPTLRAGCRILVDRRRKRLEEDKIFVLRTDNGLVVNRARLGPGGNWLLFNDNPAFPQQAPWPEGAETFGKAVWTERSLV